MKKVSFTFKNIKVVTVYICYAAKEVLSILHIKSCVFLSLQLKIIFIYYCSNSILTSAKISIINLA